MKKTSVSIEMKLSLFGDEISIENLRNIYRSIRDAQGCDTNITFICDEAQVKLVEHVTGYVPERDIERRFLNSDLDFGAAENFIFRRQASGSIPPVADDTVCYATCPARLRWRRS